LFELLLLPWLLLSPPEPFLRERLRRLRRRFELPELCSSWESLRFGWRLCPELCFCLLLRLRRLRRRLDGFFFSSLICASVLGHGKAACFPLRGSMVWDDPVSLLKSRSQAGVAFTHLRERRVFLPLKLGSQAPVLASAASCPFDMNVARSCHQEYSLRTWRGLGRASTFTLKALTSCGGSLRTPCHRSTADRARFQRPWFSLPSFPSGCVPTPRCTQHTSLPLVGGVGGMTSASLQEPSFAILASPHARRKAFHTPVCFPRVAGVYILCVGAARRWRRLPWELSMNLG